MRSRTHPMLAYLLIGFGLFSLVVNAGWLGDRSPGWDTGWLFLLGLAATFGVLYFLPDAQGKQRWAVYPALGALALVLLIVLSDALGRVFVPLLLVLAGIVLLWRRGGSSKGPTLPRRSA